jgi:hypothetical protein
MDKTVYVGRQRAIPRFPSDNLDSFAERNLPMRLFKNLGMILLAIWLILTGLIPLLHFTHSGLGILMAILATGAGILLLLGR